jgi:hypothetical protein
MDVDKRIANVSAIGNSITVGVHLYALVHRYQPMECELLCAKLFRHHTEPADKEQKFVHEKP